MIISAFIISISIALINIFQLPLFIFSEILFLGLSIIFILQALKVRKKPVSSFNKKDIFLYFLFAIYPYCHLYLINFKEADTPLFLIVLTISLTIPALILLFLNLLLKNSNKALIIACLFCLFISFAGLSAEYVNIFSAIILFLAILILTFDIKNVFHFFRAFSIMLVCFLISDFIFNVPIFNVQPKAETLTAKPSELKNDVYIILLDMYSGDEILKSEFNFDNSAFYNELNALGFRVFPDIYSNYNKTNATLGSIFNLDYLQNIPFKNYDEAFPMNLTFKKAREKGYDTEVISEETVKIRSSSYFGNTVKFNKVATYNQVRMYLKPTFFEFFSDYMDLNPICSVGKILEYTLKEKTADEHRFWFLHIMAPHYPYLNPNNPYGKDNIKGKNPSEFYINKKAYISYLEYVNSELLRVIDELIKISDTKPVILIFGDHGVRLHYFEIDEKAHFKELMREKNFIKAHFDTFFAIYADKEELSHYDGAKSLLNLFIEFYNARFNENVKRVEDKFYYHYYNESLEYKNIIEKSIKFKLKDKGFIPLSAK